VILSKTLQQAAASSAALNTFLNKLRHLTGKEQACSSKVEGAAYSRDNGHKVDHTKITDLLPTEATRGISS